MLLDAFRDFPRRGARKSAAFLGLLGFFAMTLLAPPGVAQQPDRASRFYEDAQARFERNDVAGAIIQLKNALQQDPKLLAAYVLLGRAQLTAGDSAAAEDAFSKAIQLGVDRSVVAVPMAQALYDQGKYEAMLERFPAEGLAPDRQVEVLLLRAHAFRRTGDIPSAVKALDQARRIDPDFVPALLSEAELRADEGKHAEAETLSARALKLAPNDPRVWNMRATLALAKGDTATAIQALDKALAIEPRYTDARIARLSILVSLGRTQEADRDLAYLKANNPDDPRANYLRAVELARLGDNPGARDALSEVIRVLDPAPRDVLRKRGPQLLLLGGVAHYSLGSGEKSRSYLEDYLKLFPRHLGARRLLGSVYLGVGDARAAISVLEPARRTTPDDADILALLAAAHLARRQHQIATDYLERALEVSGGKPAIHATLGLSLLGSGQSELGVAQLEEAFKKEPGQARAGLPLAAFYLKSGNPKRATEVAEAIVKREPDNPAMLNLLGVARVAAGDRAGGRKAYERATALERTFAAPQLNLAKLDLAEGKADASRVRLERFLKDRPNDTRAMYELARAEAQAGRTVEAIRWLEKAFALNRREVAAAAMLVDLHIARKDFDKALNVAKDAEATAPENLVVLAALGRAYIALGNRKLAQTVFDRMSRIAAFNPAWQTDIARYQLAADNRAGASHGLDKALVAKPDYLPALVLRVELELGGGDVKSAEQHAKAIVARNPEAAIGYRLQGDVAFAKKDYPRAIAAYRSALSKQSSTDTAVRLYQALAASGDLAKAIALMEEWVSTRSSDAVALRALAEANLGAGNLAAARARYEQVAKLRPDDAFVLNNLAVIMTRQGQLAGAREFADRAYRLDPKSAAIQDTLGWVLVQSGELEPGIRHLREARLRDPQSGEIRYHLAAALSKAGRSDEARRELEPAISGGDPFESRERAGHLWADLSGK